MEPNRLKVLLSLFRVGLQLGAVSDERLTYG